MGRRAPPGASPLGRSPNAGLEPLRVGQEPSLAFAASQLHAFEPGTGDRLPRLSILGFGLFGPNGRFRFTSPSIARERILYHDRTFVSFANILHHRFTLLFYRAWADVQSAASLDRPGDDSFSRYSASLIHLGEAVGAEARCGRRSCQALHVGPPRAETRNAEGLERILATFFRAGVRIEQWVSHWLALAREQQTRSAAGRDAEQIGIGAVAARRFPTCSRGSASLRPPVPRRIRVASAGRHALRADARVAAQLHRLRACVGRTARAAPRGSAAGRDRQQRAPRLDHVARHPPREDDADDLVLVHETIVARQSLLTS
jgi:type VI secretion system ImpH/TssG family protein